MKIGIVGAGNKGEALGKLWAKAGHHVIFSCSRDDAKLHELVTAAGATARVSTLVDLIADCVMKPLMRAV